MNQTKIQVPKIAVTKAKMARPQIVDAGINRRASKMPNCAEEIVAPVVGDTNLFIQSCCIIRPATLIPTPVQSIASRRGRREIRKVSHCCLLPFKSSDMFTSRTPMNSEQTDKTSNTIARIMVNLYFLIKIPPYKFAS